MNKNPFVDIIILNLNQEEDTAACIASLKGMRYREYRVILVDNGSVDGSGTRLKERFADIVLIRNERNLGFAGGCNTGIAHSLNDGRADYIVLLNSDTTVDENLLNALVDGAQASEETGIVGAVTFYHDRPDTVHVAGHRFIWWLGIQQGVRTLDAELKELQSASGCCMLIKKGVFEDIGLFDNRFFSYYEDADLCLRAKQKSYRVVAARGAKVWHAINKVIGSKSPQEYYIYTRNQPLFMLKHCPRIFLVNYFLVYFVKVMVRMVCFCITGRADRAAGIRDGLVDFLKKRFGEGRLFSQGRHRER